MVGRRLVYSIFDTEVIIRPWVDTTYLDNGVEKAYIKQCKLHYSFTSNKPANYVRIYRRQFVNNAMWTAWSEASGSSGSFFSNVEYERVIATAIDISNQSPITQFKVSFEFNSEEVFSQIVTVCIDYDGNVYNMIKIGSQWWTCENMRAVHYTDGTSITNGETLKSSTTPYYYEYIQNGENLFEKAPLLGRLYNWPAATKSSDGSSDVNIQGLAPTGFHIPSDSEIQTLVDTVANDDTDYAARLCDNRYYKQFPSTGLTYNQYYKWVDSSESEVAGNYDANDRNNSLFCAIPAGVYNGSCIDFGYSFNFWSATHSNSNNAYYRYLYYYRAYMGHFNYYKYYGCSVRCICNHDLDTI